MPAKLSERAKLLKRYKSVRTDKNLPVLHVGLLRKNNEELKAAIRDLERRKPNALTLKDYQTPARQDVWNALKNKGLTEGLTYKNQSTKELMKLANTNGIRYNIKPKKNKLILNPITGRPISKNIVDKFVSLGYRVHNGQLKPPKNGKYLRLVESDQTMSNGNKMKVFSITKDMQTKYKSGVLTYDLYDTITGAYVGSGIRYINISNHYAATNVLNNITYEEEESGNELRNIKLRLLPKNKTIDFSASYHNDASLLMQDFIDQFAYETYDLSQYVINAYIPDSLEEDHYRDNDKKIIVRAAYLSEERNCVITAIESCLKKDLNHLHIKYREGVFKSDFNDIASSIKRTIMLHIGSDIIEFGGHPKKIHLRYFNNHVVAEKESKQEIIRVSKIDLKEILSNENVFKIQDINFDKDNDIIKVEFTDSVYLKDKQTIGNKSYKLDGTSATIISEFKTQFINANEITPCTLGIAKDFCRHGIKLIVDKDMKGCTVDLKNAYSNFESYDFYEGMPLDITFHVETPTNDEIKYIINNYAGFALVEWTNLFNRLIETRWVSIPHLVARLDLVEEIGFKNYQLNIKSFALAYRKTDNINMTMFENHDKRLFHKVLGSMSSTTSYESIATTDPVLAASYNLSKIHQHNGIDIYQGKSHEFDRSSFYTFIPAYIQGYTEIMMERMYVRITQGLIKYERIGSIYVDGIATNMTKSELAPFIDERWHVKPNVKFMYNSETFTKNFKYSLNYYDQSYTCVLNYGHPKKFVKLPVSGKNRIKVIDGPAGTGKSTMIKKLRQMIDCPILVQTNEQKDIFINSGFNRVETVDMYLTKRFGTNIDNFVIIDEYFQMDRQKLLSFKNAILFGNRDQLSVGKNLISMYDYDYHQLWKVYRFDEKLQSVSKKILNEFDYTDINSIEIHDALLEGYNILAAKHETIELINDIGLKLGLPKKIRWTKTDLKQDIYANDTGIYKNGVCINNRTGKSYKTQPGRITMEKTPMIVYAYARTFHSTQGQEYDKVCCVLDGLNQVKRKHLYTGVTRCKSIDGLRVCFVNKPKDESDDYDALIA